MIYSAKINLILDNEFIGSFPIYNYEGGAPPIQLKDIAEYAKNNLLTQAKYDTLFINDVKPACKGIIDDFKNQDIPEDLKEVFETSKKEWEDYMASDDYKRILFLKDLEAMKVNLENVKQQAISLKMLDSQEFLEYQDLLNSYSLDPDRK